MFSMAKQFFSFSLIVGIAINANAASCQLETLWRTQITGIFYASHFEIGPNNDIYLNSSDESSAAQIIQAFNINGKKRFSLATDRWLSSFTVRQDGSLYSVINNKLIAQDHNGNVSWSYESTDTLFTGPVIVNNNFIVVMSLSSIYAIDLNGKQRWIYTHASTSPFSGITMASDGTIYASIKDHTELHAISPDGKLQWVYKEKRP